VALTFKEMPSSAPPRPMIVVGNGITTPYTYVSESAYRGGYSMGLHNFSSNTAPAAPGSAPAWYRGHADGVQTRERINSDPHFKQGWRAGLGDENPHRPGTAEFCSWNAGQSAHLAFVSGEQLRPSISMLAYLTQSVARGVQKGLSAGTTNVPYSAKRACTFTSLECDTARLNNPETLGPPIKWLLADLCRLKGPLYFDQVTNLKIKDYTESVSQEWQGVRITSYLSPKILVFSASVSCKE
jgi:hypothetical protein